MFYSTKHRSIFICSHRVKPLESELWLVSHSKTDTNTVGIAKTKQVKSKENRKETRKKTAYNGHDENIYDDDDDDDVANVDNNHDDADDDHMLVASCQLLMVVFWFLWFFIVIPISPAVVFVITLVVCV